MWTTSGSRRTPAAANPDPLTSAQELNALYPEVPAGPSSATSFVALTGNPPVIFARELSDEGKQLFNFGLDNQDASLVIAQPLIRGASLTQDEVERTQVRSVSVDKLNAAQSNRAFPPPCL